MSKDSNSKPQVRETLHAETATTVHKYEPAVYDKPAEGPALARIHLEESFVGDLKGSGVAEVLQAATGEGTASFAAMERVTGEISGRQGTFLLQVAGTIADKTVSAEWFAVPGSGTGRLAGLRGKGGFRARLGEGGHGEFDYWFEQDKSW